MSRWFDTPDLLFAVGIEDTFVPQARTGARSLDEYELTQHYDHWHSDLGLASESGATMIRWGIPWYRVNPAPGIWDWSWLDQVVDRLDELGLTPIVDLMHYGTPMWLDNQFVNDSYDEGVAEYAGRVAERYRNRLTVFTPLNEPLLNIMYCGEFGYWPPYLTGDDGFVKLLRGIARGIVLSQRAISDVSADNTFVHVEASFRFTGETVGQEQISEHLQHRAFLVQDLVTGRVGDEHPLAPYLRAHGFTADDFAWHRDNIAVPDVMGVNHYPALSTELFEAGVAHTGGPLDPRPRIDDWTDGLAEVLTVWQQRYDVPVFLTETCYTGTVDQRLKWLDASVECVHQLRRDGVDVIGYTWWAVFDMFEWTYRDGTEPVEAYHLPMGLWDLQLDGTGTWRRVKNPVADRYQDHATRSGASTRVARAAEVTA
jgi:beta-glucosidase